jgi:glucose/arabinose dehydrogenase
MPSRRSRVSGAVVCLALLLAASRTAALISDDAFTETVLVASAELDGATGLAWAPDGTHRLFVIRKNGVILIIKDGALLPTPFATVAPVYQNSECGLIGITFDPDFLVNRYVYVFATVSPTEQQIIRYTADGDTGTQKTVVVAGLPTRGQNHDGGALGFGADGKLYWGIGDLGDGTGVGDDLTSLASKIGRANVDGSPPTDNPHADGAGPNADHIW